MENTHAVPFIILIIFGCFYILCVQLHNLSLNPSKITLQNNGISAKSITTMSQNRDALEIALSKASMANKTVIIAMINKAYVDQEVNGKTMMELFLDGFWYGQDTRALTNHLLIVAVDQTAFERCEFLRLRCFELESDERVEIEAEKVYMSGDFISMMWTRTHFLGEVLRRGYSFIFTDIDVMWLRNPFPKLSNDTNIDIQLSVDFFSGDPTSKTSHINTGFYMVRSNNKTVALFDAWYARKNVSLGIKEQDVLHNMIREGTLETLNVTARFLDTLYFSGFCQLGKDFKAIATVHANCCRTINAKVADLTAVIRDWKRFKSLVSSSNQSTLSMMTWTRHQACMDSWRQFID